MRVLPDEIPERGTFDGYVVDVYDGDTIYLALPKLVKGRLDGLQAAELNTPKGKEVAEWLRSRIAGKWVGVDLRGFYKYGGRVRELMTVITDPAGVDVNAEMIQTGRAVYWDGKGPRPVGREEPEAGL
jgi:endonuclease YncB( thermonuclease family)